MTEPITRDAPSNEMKETLQGILDRHYATTVEIIAKDRKMQPAEVQAIIDTALRQAGSGLDDIVRVTYIVPNAAEFQECWPVLRKYLGAIRPAATMISAHN